MKVWLGVFPLTEHQVHKAAESMQTRKPCKIPPYSAKDVSVRSIFKGEKTNWRAAELAG